MEQCSRKEFLSMAGISAASLCGLSFLSSCSGIQRNDRRTTLASSAPYEAGAIEREILTLASLAPSGHNTQPWTVRMMSPGKMRIGTERSRWLPGVDPQNRECMLSLGAFIETLVIAAGTAGYVVSVDVIGKTAFEKEIAEITFTKGSVLGFDRSKITARRTVRKGHLGDELKTGDVSFITQDSPDHLQYIPLHSPHGKYLTASTIEANRVQAWRQDAQEELSRWIRFSNTDAKRFRNGLTTESMEIQGIAGLFVRSFYNAGSVMSENFRNQTVDIVKEQTSQCAGWIILTSENSSVSALIETGRRFQRMFLRIRERNVALHPMTQILEEKPFMNDAAKQLGIERQIQFILRTGYLRSYPDPVSLRMPIDWFMR